MNIRGEFVNGADDFDCDGVADGHCLLIERNDAGEVKLERSDCDDVPDYCEYGDAHDNLVGIDEDCDGTFDSTCVTVVYDDLERMIVNAQDADCDGVLDNFCNEYVYSADGLSYTQRMDSECNGNMTCRVDSTYLTPNGSFVSFEDANCDGVPDSRCSEVAASDGASVQLWDDNCDGEFDECAVGLDESGNVIVSVDDTNCNGVPTSCLVIRVVH